MKAQQSKRQRLEEIAKAADVSETSLQKRERLGRGKQRKLDRL